MLVVVGIVVLSLAVPGVFALMTWNRIDRVDVDLVGSPPGGTTYLLVGSDSRAGVTSDVDRASFGDVTQAPDENADLILLLRVPDDGSPPRLLAVPRDLLVFVAPRAPGRIGPTLNDGPQKLVDSICRTLGIGVDHLATIRFLSFAHLVDVVGGVEVSMPYPERDTVLDFQYDAGPHHLDGRDAVTYVRVRHVEQYRDGSWVSDPATALGRSTRAREVLQQIGADAPSPSDPLGFARFAWAVSGAVTVDGSSGLGDLRHLGDALRSIDRARELRLPVTFRDGAVPLAKLRPGAVATVQRFQGLPRRGRCADPQMPLDDGTVAHPGRAGSSAVTAPR
ncbi:MAG TPA: LCP family protein [Acidimicrobiia bacterium]|nr:LCP family protein [Acidimicrobiia bacterium]